MVRGVACQAIAWRRLPLARYLAEAGRAGYEGSELTSRQAALWSRHGVDLGEELRRGGLPLIALYHSARLCCGPGLDVELQDSVRAINLARDLGAGLLVLGNPPRHRVHAGSGLGTLKDSLNQLGVICARAGIVLTYQPHYGGPVQTPSEVDDLMSGTDSGLVSLCLDTAHIAWGGGHPADLMRRWGPRVRYIQIKDLRPSVPGWRQRLAWLGDYARLGSMKGYYEGLYPLQQVLRTSSSLMFVAPGRGCLDFSAFRKSMESTDYRGWLTVELDAPLLHPGRAMAEALEAACSLLGLPRF